jgi:hypothetical protein
MNNGKWQLFVKKSLLFYSSMHNLKNDEDVWFCQNIDTYSLYAQSDWKQYANENEKKEKKHASLNVSAECCCNPHFDDRMIIWIYMRIYIYIKEKTKAYKHTWSMLFYVYKCMYIYTSFPFFFMYIFLFYYDVYLLDYCLIDLEKMGM